MSIGPDPSVVVRRGTYEELADWLEPGAVGSAIDVNNILYQKSDANTMQPVSKGCAVPYALTAAGTLKVGDRVSLGAGGIPTLPPLAGTVSGLTGQPAPVPGQEVQITNTTGAAINVATGAGASINGVAAGTAYALAAGATKTFILDATRTNWMVF